jgi:hypothetical protein
MTVDVKLCGPFAKHPPVNSGLIHTHKLRIPPKHTEYSHFYSDDTVFKSDTHQATMASGLQTLRLLGSHVTADIVCAHHGPTSSAKWPQFTKHLSLLMDVNELYVHSKKGSYRRFKSDNGDLIYQMSYASLQNRSTTPQSNDKHAETLGRYFTSRLGKPVNISLSDCSTQDIREMNEYITQGEQGPNKFLYHNLTVTEGETLDSCKICGDH